jgi:hypothetical protein
MAKNTSDGRMSGTGSPPEPPTPGALTHELAQLLAASLAQSKAHSPSLQSLSALKPQPVHDRSGLSSLTLPHPPIPPPPPLPLHADDEPMPIPSTWRETASDDDRWFRQQLGAAALGLLAGLMVVIPSVLWLSGWLSAVKKPRPVVAAQSEMAPPEVKTTEVKTLRVHVRPVDTPVETTQFVAASAEPRLPPEAAPVKPPVVVSAAVEIKPTELRRRSDDVLAQVQRRIEAGDVRGARELLNTAEALEPGSKAFALAETYDPNMLAAWGTRGVNADVLKAKALYAKALNSGIARAQARLDALK